MKSKPIPFTQAELHELLRYDPETGRLFWRVDRNSCVLAGAEAGYHRNSGYRMLGIKGQGYLAHRVIWVMARGRIRGDMEIDHINGDRSDNRITNLRLVTGQGNRWNLTSAKGYHWCKCAGKWRSMIMVDRKSIHLGLYSTEAEARAAYLEAKPKYHQIA